MARLGTGSRWSAKSIIFAARTGDAGKVESIILEAPSLINARDNDGATPLHHAAERGFTNVAQLLLAVDADVNAQKRDGVTPLHVASALGRKAIVALLLANRADVTAKDRKGRNAISLARANGHPDVAELLANPNLQPAHALKTDAIAEPSSPAKLPQPAEPAPQSQADVAGMFELVNKERAAEKLPPYQLDEEVSKVATAKAKDMAEKHYIEHRSPTYGDPGEMLKRFGVSWAASGENIASYTTVRAAHDALMKSPGHRSNIMSTEFDRIGIGTARGLNGQRLFVQLFVRRQ